MNEIPDTINGTISSLIRILLFLFRLPSFHSFLTFPIRSYFSFFSINAYLTFLVIIAFCLLSKELAKSV